MSDAPRESAVFGGLDAFDDHSTDADAMDHMLLNLAAAASDPADWHIDDFYTPPPPSPPLNYPDHDHSSVPAAAAATATAAPASSSNPDAARMQVTLNGRATATLNPPHALSSSKSPSTSDTPMTPPQPLQTPVSTPQSNARKRPHTPQPARSPASSGSSAKPRVPTALCSLCGKNISTNGANFRRHEAACRRQRGDKLSQPAATPPLAPPPFPPPPQPPASSNATAVAAMARRDSDLLNVVRRLETSIGTLDVSARLCLRDALVSLSNKASNPQVPPTPQQEAMNRAAEYLVLRMLFLSGEQVMHTAPGTAGYPGAAEASQSTPQPARPPAPPPDDGTVAASTATAAAASVVKKEEPPVKSCPKSEPTMGDGT